MLAVYSGLLRALSVSSMRSRNWPPWRRANSQLNNAVRAVPMCRVPVGLGARRTRTEDPAALANFTQTFSDSVNGLRFNKLARI